MLKDIELKPLERGMYVRFVLTFVGESYPDKSSLIDLINEYENVKYVEQITTDIIVFVLYVEADNSYEPQKLVKYISSCIPSHEHFTIEYATTNHGSLDTSVAGRYQRLEGQKARNDNQYLDNTLTEIGDNEEQGTLYQSVHESFVRLHNDHAVSLPHGRNETKTSTKNDAGLSTEPDEQKTECLLIPSLETCEKIWLQTDCGKIDAEFAEAEKQKLDNGMYIRIAILLGKEMADMEPLIGKIEAIENVKCAIRRNGRLLYVLLFVADCLSRQDIADMSKYDVWHKHDKTAKRTVMAFQEQLNEIIREFDIHSYQAYYATTNFGSFSTRAAGNLAYELGNDDIDQRFFACPNESFENEVDRDLNGVKGYRRIYPIVTTTD